MTRSFTVCCILAALAFGIGSAASAESVSGVQKLDGVWQWAPADAAEGPDATAGKEFLPLGRRDDLKGLIPGDEGFIWVRGRFSLDAALRGKPLAMHLGRIAMTDETWLNGVLVGATGRLPPDFFSAWNQERLYSAPLPLLRQEGENELLLRIWLGGEGGINGVLSIGEPEAVGRLWSAGDFANSGFNLLISAIVLVFALYYLWLFVKRPADRENLFYALTSLGFGLYLSNFWVFRLPFDLSGLSYLGFQKFIFIAQFAMVAALCLFIVLFLKHQARRLSLILVGASFAAASLIMAVAPDYRTLTAWRGAAQLAGLAWPLVYAITCLARAAFRRSREAVLLAIGFSPVLATAAFDIVAHLVLGLNDLPYLGGLGFPLFLLTTLFILASRFADVSRKAELLSSDLEGVVRERTEALTGLVGRVGRVTAGVSGHIAEVADSIVRTTAATREIDLAAQGVRESAARQVASLDAGVGDVQAINREMVRVMDISRENKQAFQDLISVIAERLEFIRGLDAKSKALSRQMADLSEGIASAGRSVGNMAQAIEQIQGAVAQISRLSAVIEEIAAQTNVLSFNAAIQATHAGSYGSGFAVVAREIKELAFQTQSNVGQTDAVVKSVRATAEGTHELSRAMVADLERVSSVFTEVAAFHREIDGMLGAEAESKTRISARLEALGRKLDSQIASLDSLLAKAGATAATFGFIQEQAGGIQAATGEQAGNSERLSKAIQEIAKTMEATRAEMAQLQESIRTMPGVSV